MTPSAASATAVTLYVQITGSTVGAITTQAAADDFSAVLLPITIPAGSTAPVVVSTNVAADTTTEGPEGFQAKLLDSGFLPVAGVATITGTITEGVSAGKTYALTTAIDNLTATNGTDTFNASSVDANGTGTTINPGDNLNGGDGVDTVMIAASGTTAGTNVSAVTYTNIEKILVSDYNGKVAAAVSTLDVSLADASLTTVGLSSSDTTGTLNVTGLKKVVDAEMKNGSNHLTLTFTAGNTGAADALTLAVSGQKSSTFTAEGIETVTVNSALVKSDTITLVGTNLAAVNVTGDAEVSLALPSNVKAIDASAATGKVTVDTSAITLNTITSAKGGAGTTDVIKIDEPISASSLLNKITGFEVLAISGASTTAVSLNAAVPGVSTIDMSDTAAAIQTLTLAIGYTGATSVNLAGGADYTSGVGSDTITDNANVALTVNGNVADAARVAIAAGTGTTDVLNLTADTAGATFLAGTTGIETINILANTATASNGTGAIVMNNANVANAKTLTVNASALTNAAASLSIDASAETDGRYVITGGAGNDSIKGGNVGDSLSGGAGNDTITAGTGVDSINGGDGNDTFNLGANLTGTDTIDGGSGTDKLVVTTITTSGAFANVKNVESIAISDAATVSLTAPISADLTLDLSAATTQSLTLAAGYTGNTTVVLSGDGGSGDDVINTAGVALTVKANEADLVAGSTLTGGSGTDTLIVTAGAGNANLSNVSLFENINVLANTTDATIPVTLDSLKAVDAGKSVSIDASALTSASAALTISTAAAGAGMYVVTGGAGNDDLNLTAVTGKTTINGGAGHDTVTAGSGVDSLSGGAGNDVFTMADRLTVQDTIDGGDGIDTIAITTYNPASLTNVKNVEVLAVTGNNTADIDSTASSFTSFNLTEVANAQRINLKAGYSGTATVSIAGATGDDVINGATATDTGKVDTTNSPLFANTTMTVIGNAADFVAGTTITGGTGNDTLQITADNNGTGAVLTGVTGVENIVVKASTVTAANAAKITLTAATVVADGATLTVDASDLSAAGAVLTYDGDAIKDANTTDRNGGGTATTTGTGKQVVTGGSNGDWIRTGEGSDSINGGIGDDTIISGKGLDTITSGAGSDIIDVSVNSNVLAFATVNDFAAGDRLYFSTGSGAPVTTFNKVTLSASATLSDYIHAAASVTTGTHSQVSWFQFGGNTYVVQDNGNTNAFVANTDRVIELKGLLDLSDTPTVKAAVTVSGTTQTLTYASTGTNVASVAAPAMSFTQSSAANAAWVGTLQADSFVFGSFLNADDTVTGAGGADTLSFTDANSAATDLDNVTFSSSVTITLGDAITSVTTPDALMTVDASTLTVNGSGLTAGKTLTWNGANEANAEQSVTGGAASDTITGGGGDDTITGGALADNLVGNAGIDVFVMAAVADFAAGETITGGANTGGQDIIRLDTAGTYGNTVLSATVTGIEGVILNQNAAGWSLTFHDGAYSGADTDGNAAADGTVTVQAGLALTNGVTIVGGATTTTNELVVVGTNLGGGDTITGGNGNDTIDGGAGTDFITSGPGVDSLTGGTGTDRFIFTHTVTGNRDLITDFEEGAAADAIYIDISALPIRGAASGAAAITDPAGTATAPATGAGGYLTGTTNANNLTGATIYEVTGVTTDGSAGDLITKLGASATTGTALAGTDKFLIVNYTAGSIAQVWYYTGDAGDGSGGAADTNINADELQLIGTLNAVVADGITVDNFFYF